MKKRKESLILFVIILIFLTGCGKNYATYDGGSISYKEVEEYSKKKIDRIKAQISEVRRQAASELLFQQLIKKDSEGKSVQSYFSDYINRQKKSVSEESARNYLLINNGLTYKITPQAIQSARHRIVSKKINIYRNLLLFNLKKKYHVKIAEKINIEKSGRKKFSYNQMPFRGPKNAPVVIVEFSDFQCPYCQRGYNTLLEVFKLYKEKIRWVYADFPLGFHKLAKPASYAARCAGEQNKFWQYHDALFSKQRLTQRDDLILIAKVIKLNMGSFQKCLKSDKYKAKVLKDMALGRKLGVSGTPAFFINGRFISGAIPLTEFVSQIESEL